MCLVTFAVGEHSRYPFVLVANRDERYERASAGLHFWDDQPDLLAGRDLEHGGTWLGLTRAGRFATLTNHPFTDWQPHGAVSRGNLVSDFLNGEMSAEEYLDVLRGSRERYEGYHLIFGSVVGEAAGSGAKADETGAELAGVGAVTGVRAEAASVGQGQSKGKNQDQNQGGLWVYSNVEDRVERYDRGLHSVGNTYDDLTMHKQTRSCAMLAGYLGLATSFGVIGDDAAHAQATETLKELASLTTNTREDLDLNPDELLAFFQDRVPASNLTVIPDQLPLEIARKNSSIFIQGDYFGTVGSTVILVDHDGWVHVKEVRYNQESIIEISEKQFKLGPSAQSLRPHGQRTNEVTE